MTALLVAQMVIVRAPNQNLAAQFLAGVNHVKIRTASDPKPQHQAPSLKFLIAPLWCLGTPCHVELLVAFSVARSKHNIAHYSISPECCGPHVFVSVGVGGKLTIIPTVFWWKIEVGVNGYTIAPVEGNPGNHVELSFLISANNAIPILAKTKASPSQTFKFIKV